MDESRRDEVVKLGKVLLEVCITLGIELVLIDGLAVAAIESHEVPHARLDEGERREAHGIQTMVIAIVHKDLSSTATGLSSSVLIGSESDVAASIGPHNGIIGDLSVPLGRDLRVTVDAPLNDKRSRSHDDAEETVIVVVAILHQSVETIDSVGRPSTNRMNDCCALCSVEKDVKLSRRCM